jgi:Zn-dependent M28 family amino/carboxypeptidase
VAAGPVIELCAHWDSVAGSPGADDNASGVAGLLEIARVFAAGEVPRGRLRFCLFGEEEDEQIGYLGSRAHVARLDVEGMPVSGAVVLEMIGYRDSSPGSQRFPEDLVPEGSPLRAFDRGDFIAAIGNQGTEPWLEAVRVAGQAEEPSLPVLSIPVPADVGGNATRSDHLPYWRSGRSGVLITDTAEFRNPHYHRPTDLPTTLDYAFAAAVTRTVARTLRTLTT